MATGPPMPPIYAPGQELDAFKHSAPKVAKPEPWCDTYEGASSLIDRCRCERPQNPSLKLEIVKLIDMGYKSGSQIALVNISDGHLSGKQLVAKFFDPFYFDDDDGYLCPLKVTTREYAQEVTAYENLKSLQGDGIPKFFGSFAVYFELPQLKAGVKDRFREVPLILLENIAGESMNEVELSDYTLESRKEMMKAVIKLDRRVYEAGFVIRHLKPQNFIVSGTKLTLVGLETAIDTDPYFKGNDIALKRWGKVPCNFHAWLEHKSWNWKRWIAEEFGGQ